MKSWLIKTLASAALKNAIAYAAASAGLAVAAVKGVLEKGYLDDQARVKITSVLKALMAIEDFLIKVRTLFGVPAAPLSYTSAIQLDDFADRLNHAAGQL